MIIPKNAVVTAAFLIGLICGVILIPNHNAQATELWDYLEPGPYTVGFRTIEDYDYSRVYLPKRDYFGNPQEGERARPIQISLWYPAETMADKPSPNMVFGEYNFPYPLDSAFIGQISALQNRELVYLNYVFRGDRGVVLDFISIEMNAVRDANPAGGKFPLLIYSPDILGGIGDNALLCEYLASHGFVVATTHNMGTHESNTQFNHADLETQLMDKDFLFGQMRKFSYVDMSKIGVFGDGFGGLASLLFPMRNSDVDAALSLNGSFLDSTRLDFTMECPYFGYENLTVPLMNIYSDETGQLNLSIIDSLRYSERTNIALKKSPQSVFQNYHLLASLLPDRADSVSPDEKEGYKLICQYTYNYFNAYLNLDGTSKEFLANPPEDNGIAPGILTKNRLEAQEIPPTQAEFVEIIRQQGVSQAVEIYDKFNKLDPDLVLFTENTFNALGYQFLQAGEIDNALTIFKLNTEKYPNSCNTWDSYSEALLADGQVEKGIEALKKALAVMPEDNTSSEDLKEAIRAHARQVFEQYNVEE
jgi:hypothetical protein